jgi:hypothetical protein
MSTEMPRIRQFTMTAGFVRAVMNLSANEGRRVWKTLELLTRDPNSPGLGLENLRGIAALKSARVSERLRLILWSSSHTPVVVFVGGHDEAYRYATRLCPGSRDDGLLPIGVFARLSISPLQSYMEHVIYDKSGDFWQFSRPLDRGTAKSLLTHGRKYLPLMQYLLSRNPEDQSCMLDFPGLEEILGFRLPPFARTFRAWWANDLKHPQSKAWLAAGWRTGEVSIPDRVQFVLEESGLARSKQLKEEMEKAGASYRELMENTALSIEKRNKQARKEEKARMLLPGNEECRRLAKQMASLGLTCPFCKHKGINFRFYDGALEFESYFICNGCGRSFRLTDIRQRRS